MSAKRSRKGRSPGKPSSEQRPPAKRPPAPREPEPPPPQEIPQRMVGIAYVLALVCLVAPLAILGSGFAGALLFTRGRRQEGAGVLVVSVVCAVAGFYMRTR
jgi:hypothetical protein